MQYGDKSYNAVKDDILINFGVEKSEDFDVVSEISGRVNYLKNHLKETGCKAYVLGISGGVDSTTVGKLCQLAVDELNSEGYECSFVAVRLPAGVQRDEEDAQEALKFINPTYSHTVNIGESATLMSNAGIVEYVNAGGLYNEKEEDFVKGNIKARLRMIVQYQLAALYGGLVISTDHNSEGVTGFYTKHGDGASDVLVLNGMNKRQVRMMAKELEAPERLWNKAPTADLEELNPGKLDDEGFGFPYDKLDDFLEGKVIDKEIEMKIINQYLKTQHKRQPTPSYKG